MHELGLMLRAIEMAEAEARTANAARIDAIHLEVGALSGVVREALEFAFQAARAGTMAERAHLEVVVVPATAYCGSCDATFEIDNRFGIASCPRCGTPSADLRQGRELNLSHLEVSG
jgi:hydrogenase nickel incorporation protein HypA/HybF